MRLLKTKFLKLGARKSEKNCMKTMPREKNTAKGKKTLATWETRAFLNGELLR